MRVNVRGEVRRIVGVDQVVCLGIALGERMMCMSKLTKVLRRDWGLRDRSARIIIKGWVETVALYGAAAWYECLRQGNAAVYRTTGGSAWGA